MCSIRQNAKKSKIFYGNCWIIQMFAVYLHKHTNKDNKNMDNTSFRKKIIDMQRGESITISVEQIGYTTIRGYASDLGFAYKRRYSTHRNREDRTYTITRIA